MWNCGAFAVNLRWWQYVIPLVFSTLASWLFIEFDLPTLNSTHQSVTYAPPVGYNPCLCNTVAYLVLSGCAHCQGATYLKYVSLNPSHDSLSPTCYQLGKMDPELHRDFKASQLLRRVFITVLTVFYPVFLTPSPPQHVYPIGLLLTRQLVLSISVSETYWLSIPANCKLHGEWLLRPWLDGCGSWRYELSPLVFFHIA